MRSFLGPENPQSPFLHLKLRFMASMICSTARARVLSFTFGFREERHMGQLVILIEHPSHVRCPFGHCRILEYVIALQTRHWTISSSFCFATFMSAIVWFCTWPTWLTWLIDLTFGHFSLWMPVSQLMLRWKKDFKCYGQQLMLWCGRREGFVLTRSTWGDNWVSVHLAVSLSNCCWLFCRNFKLKNLDWLLPKLRFHLFTRFDLNKSIVHNFRVCHNPWNVSHLIMWRLRCPRMEEFWSRTPTDLQSSQCSPLELAQLHCQHQTPVDRQLPLESSWSSFYSINR